MKTAENFSDFTFNPSSVVLARSEDSISPQEPLAFVSSSPNPDPGRIPPDKHPTAPYVTRFGRKVIPAKHYAADEWIIQAK